MGKTLDRQTVKAGAIINFKKKEDKAMTETGSSRPVRGAIERFVASVCSLFIPRGEQPQEEGEINLDGDVKNTVNSLRRAGIKLEILNLRDMGERFDEALHHVAQLCGETHSAWQELYDAKRHLRWAIRDLRTEKEEKYDK